MVVGTQCQFWLYANWLLLFLLSIYYHLYSFFCSLASKSSIKILKTFPIFFSLASSIHEDWKGIHRLMPLYVLYQLKCNKSKIVWIFFLIIKTTPPLKTFSPLFFCFTVKYWYIIYLYDKDNIIYVLCVY